MILYFSATGNSKYVAERISKETDEKMISVVDCIKENKFDFSDENIGIITPTYNWTLPSIVREFIEKANFECEYLYFIATYGTTCGATGKAANELIKGKEINAYYSVQMPDTWTPTFDLSTDEKAAKFTKNTEAQIDFIIDKISKKRNGKFMRFTIPKLLVDTVMEPIYNNKVRKTSNFVLEDSCVGCGLCAKKCPVNAIEMQNGKPKWIKDKCVMCLGCLHRCPKFAIQYKNRTKNHGQYINPNMKGKI